MTGDELQTLSEVVLSDRFPVYTVARNELYYLRNHPPPFVININTCDRFIPGPNANSGGIHWVNLWVRDKKSLGVTHCVTQFFDSFGFTNNHYEIKSPWPVDRYNPFVLQPATSSHCGEFVLFYNTKRAVGLGFDSVIKLFNKKDLVKNDERVVQNYNGLKSINGTRTSFNLAWCPRFTCTDKISALEWHRLK